MIDEKNVNDEFLEETGNDESQGNEPNETQLHFDFMDNAKYIFKSNNLIESSYNLTNNENRLLHMAIKKLKPRYIKSGLKPSELKTLKGAIEFGDIYIYANEFKKEFGIKGNSVYERLALTAKSLYDKDIKYFNEDENYKEVRWTTECEYDKNGNFVKIVFNTNLILDLLVFKTDYGKLEYKGFKQINSNSSRIYELCKGRLYKTKGKQCVRAMTIDEIKFKLDMPKDRYKTFGLFNQKVLKLAEEEINKHTDIEIEVIPIRKGRSVKEVEFRIKLKDMSEPDIDINYEIVNEISSLFDVEITPVQAMEISDEAIKATKLFNIDKSVKEYVTEKISVVQEYSKIKVIPNYVGAVIDAIKKNWQPNIILDNTQKDKFNSFNQRTYDMDDLEIKLLGWDKED